MAYFIFSKNLPNIQGTLYRIAENQSDLNNLNIIVNDYKIIEDSLDLFTQVKLNKKYVDLYDNNDKIFYKDCNTFFKNKEILNSYLIPIQEQIKNFLESNKNHPHFSRWDEYYNQIANLNLTEINYPLNVSIEEYFKNLNKPYLNILQLP